jgi:hypothetical protein
MDFSSLSEQSLRTSRLYPRAGKFIDDSHRSRGRKIAQTLVEQGSILRSVKIADTVEVTVDLKGKRVSGLRWSLSNRQPATLPAAARDANYGVW